MTLTFGSLFAGIGGFDLGFHRAGLVCRWQVEIDEAARGVLARHYPGVVRHADVRDVGAHNLAPVDVITFGSPCQDLSVAGQRRGLDGARSGLFFEAARIIRELGPRYAIWENVPGALSSNGGRDFGAALDALADAGALDLCWRVLDAQWFGVAQRRRRVFLVASFGAGTSAAAVLFEPEGGRRNPPPRREAGQGVTRGAATGVAFGGNNTSGPIDIAAGLNAKGGSGRMDFESETFVADALAEPYTVDWQASAAGDESWKGKGRSWIVDKPGLSRALTRNHTLAVAIPDVTLLLEVGARTNGDGDRDGDGIGQPGDPMYTLQASKQHGVLAPIAFSSKDYGGDAISDLSPTLRAANFDTSWANGGGPPAIAYGIGSHAGSDGEASNSSHAAGGPVGMGIVEEGVPALRAGRTQTVATTMAVRRLTPKEAERLQGFPDGWTAFDADGKPQSDSARYHQLGNAVCVAVSEWIGRRIVGAA